MAVDLAARRAEHEPEYWLPNYRALTEAECCQMADGVVPDWLADACRRMYSWTLETGTVTYEGLADKFQGRREQQQRRPNERTKRHRPDRDMSTRT